MGRLQQTSSGLLVAAELVASVNPEYIADDSESEDGTGTQGGQTVPIARFTPSSIDFHLTGSWTSYPEHSHRPSAMHGSVQLNYDFITNSLDPRLLSGPSSELDHLTNRCKNGQSERQRVELEAIASSSKWQRSESPQIALLPLMEHNEPVSAQLSTSPRPYFDPTFNPSTPIDIKGKRKQTGRGDFHSRRQGQQLSRQRRWLRTPPPTPIIIASRTSSLRASAQPLKPSQTLRGAVQAIPDTYRERVGYGIPILEPENARSPRPLPVKQEEDALEAETHNRGRRNQPGFHHPSYIARLPPVLESDPATPPGSEIVVGHAPQIHPPGFLLQRGAKRKQAEPDHDPAEHSRKRRRMGPQAQPRADDSFTAGQRVTRSASKVLSPTHSAAAVGGIPRLRNEPLSGRKRQGLAKPAASNSQKCSAAKTYPCLWPQCVGKSYTKMWSLSRHQVAVHGRGEESDGPFLCEACGGGYGRRDVLNRHRREHCPFREATPE